MIPRYLRQLQTETPVPGGRLKLVGSEGETRLIELCLRRQLERNPVTTDDAFEFMREARN
jgi:hypothetical protein